MTSHEAWARAQFIRLGRVMGATKRHMPKWLAALVGVALVIPGPQDELVVAVLIAGWLLCMKSAKRRVIRSDLSIAWNIYTEEA